MNSLNVFTFGYLPMNFRNIPQNFLNFFRNIKYAWQRATKGFCDYDVWALDHYYANLFFRSLIELKNTAHSYPANLTESEWENILNEMANCFYNCDEANEVYADTLYEAFYEATSKDSAYTWDPVQEKMVLEETFERLRKKASEQAVENDKLRTADKDKAFDLMKEYFFNLWD